jgi:hypothetical protein
MTFPVGFGSLRVTSCFSSAETAVIFWSFVVLGNENVPSLSTRPPMLTNSIGVGPCAYPMTVAVGTGRPMRSTTRPLYGIRVVQLELATIAMNRPIKNRILTSNRSNETKLSCGDRRRAGNMIWRVLSSKTSLHDGRR